MHFAGFSATYGAEYLVEGEWATGTITIRQDMQYGASFLMPYSAAVRNIYVLFSSKGGLFFEDGVVIRPFVCLATSNGADLVYNILQETITFAEPYVGGVEYLPHTLRRGSLTNLDIAIPEGTMVALVIGIMGENVTSEQFATLCFSGGLYAE